MPRIICRTYSSGIFKGVTFTEQIVDGKHVGVAETDDEQALAWFRSRRGFDVDEPEPESEPDKALEDHTVDELREIAREGEIDLGGAKAKADIVAAIVAATEGEPDDDAPPAE